MNPINNIISLIYYNENSTILISIRMILLNLIIVHWHAFVVAVNRWILDHASEN